MRKAFRDLLIEALREFSTRGYVSESDLQQWTARLHAMIESELPTDEESREVLAGILGSVYARGFKNAFGTGIPNVSRYTLDRIAPHIRAELDKRIFAGVDLIKLQKRSATEKTLQRFSGWLSSVPPNGLPPDTSLRDAVREIGMPIAQLKYERRRCAIDQAHKMVAAVSHTVAMNEGAIAATWYDRGEDDANYNARKEHLARSGKLYLVKDSWALNDGLIKRGSYPYTDSVTQPAYEVYCSCFWTWHTALTSLPQDALTKKGEAWIKGLHAVA